MSRISFLFTALLASTSLVASHASADDPPAPSSSPAPAASPQPSAQAPAAAPPPASAEATAAMIGKVQAFYDSTTSFQSPFTQEFFVKSHNLRKESSGKVTFSKPGKMLWEYANPAGNL